MHQKQDNVNFLWFPTITASSRQTGWIGWLGETWVRVCVYALCTCMCMRDEQSDVLRGNVDVACRLALGIRICSTELGS